MSSHPDVLIIGGGVIGLTSAYFLAREGVAVAVIDQRDFGQEASWAGAGILPPGAPAPELAPYDALRAHSSQLFPTLSAELRQRTGVDNGFLKCGGLEIVPMDSDADDEWHGAGVAYELVEGAALRRLEPQVAPGIERAWLLPDMAQVRNPRHVKALLAGCAGLGVDLRPGCPCLGFAQQGDRVTALHTAAGPISAGRYLIAAGAWSDGLLAPLGWRPGVRPVRGQIALLNTGAPQFRRVLCSGKRYLVPRADGRVLVGSTEEDVGFDKRTTAQAAGELLAFAQSLVPALGQAQLERCWAGLRPGSPDGLPFLGPVPGVDNVLVAAGHYRCGLQLSAATGLVLKEYLRSQPLTVPLDAFRLDRGGAVRSAP